MDSESTYFIIKYNKKNERSRRTIEILTPTPTRARIKQADRMSVELQFECPECGVTITTRVNPITHVHTTFCKECNTILRLLVRQSRPDSFAPPQETRPQEQKSR